MISNVQAIADFDKYVDGVEAGSIVAGEHVRAAVMRHIDDLERMESGEFPYHFDRDAANWAIEGFPLIFRHTVGAYAGSPFVLSPWQAFIIGSIFGWKCEDGSRRFRRAYVTLGRKNGKSTLAAAIAILLAEFDNEKQAQVFIGATKYDQAKVIFDEADRMIRNSPGLASLGKVMVSRIKFGDSYIRPLGSDKAFDGLNPHGIIFDELHAWKEQHRPFYDTLTTGSASRRQPLRFTITTAGDTKSQLWIEEENHAKMVVSGEIKEEGYFVFIACLDKEDDPLDETTWPKSMPNLGVSVSIDYIREQAREALVSPKARNRFIRYFANRQVSSNEQAIDVQEWDNCEGQLSDWTTADVVCGAMDAGGRNDMGAIAMVARFPDGFDSEGETNWRYECRVKCYMDTETNRDLDEMPWMQWVQMNQLKVVPYVFTSMRDELAFDMQSVSGRQIGFDPWATQAIAEEMQQEGFECVRINQNRFNLHEPLDLFLSSIKKRSITHDGHPVLRWAVQNLVINSDSQDRWMPDRKESADKIDPVVALIMALRLASLAPNRPKGPAFIS